MSGLTTKKQLSEAIQSVRPAMGYLPGYQGHSVPRDRFGDMNEVFPNIYVGDMDSANNIQNLKKVGITHVLNTAYGDGFGAVKTNENLYADNGIKYMKLDLMDMPSVNIAKYFDSSAEFIEDALRSGGKVLVHCFMGISRSATITCAFLMLNRGMTAVEALQQLRKNRCVCPNDGFLIQLAELDNNLAEKRTGRP